MVSLGLILVISVSSVRRILQQMAIKPWHYRSWIFPRDPLFAEKASRVLDLYQGLWDGKPLGPKDYVLCADEKTCIQALSHREPTVAPRGGHGVLVDSEYASVRPREGSCRDLPREGCGGATGRITAGRSGHLDASETVMALGPPSGMKMSRSRRSRTMRWAKRGRVPLVQRARF